MVKGFYRASSHDITPVEQCLLQLPLADKAAQTVCDWMNLRGIAPYDEVTGRGTVRHLFTRCAMHTPDAVLCIVSARGFGAQTDDLIAYLREHSPELTGIVLNINKQKGNVVLAGDFYTLWGEPELTDRLCGLTFTLSPQAFYQVNPVQAERLYERAVEYAVNAPTDQVLDLYCGAGTISLCLARKAAHVIGAEIVPEAIENARRNAERNGIENVRSFFAPMPVPLRRSWPGAASVRTALWLIPRARACPRKPLTRWCPCSRHGLSMSPATRARSRAT